MKKKLHKYSSFELYVFGMLLALELIMSFTFLGYIHLDPISVTTAYLPIVVVGCLVDPLASTICGLVFGLGSLYKASALYVVSADRVFSPVQSGNPFGSIMLSVGSRALFGFIIGLLFALGRKSSKYYPLWSAFVCFIAGRLHAILVYTAMGLFFPDLGFGSGSAVFFSWDDLLLSMVTILLVELLYMLYHSPLIQKYADAVNLSTKHTVDSSKPLVGLGIVTAFIACMAVLSTFYFSNRATYMLGQHHVDVTSAISSDLLHLQIQFLLAMLALDVILIELIIIVYRYMSYREYQGEIDALTGIMGRRLFLSYCTKVQQNRKPADSPKGWFLFLDVDYFKQINDTLGHTVGDETLKQVAHILQNAFGSSGAVGRVGGDEFAVMVNQEMSSQELSKRLDQFLADVATILPQRTVSCSIGAYHFVFPQEINHLLAETDQVLYQAKANGRACFIIQD